MENPLLIHGWFGGTKTPYFSEKYPPYPPRSWGHQSHTPPLSKPTHLPCVEDPWPSRLQHVAASKTTLFRASSVSLPLFISMFFANSAGWGLSKTHLGSIFNLIKSSKKYDVISYYATVDGWNPKASHMGCSPNPVNNGKTTNLNWWVYRISSTVLHYTFWRSLSLVS